MASAAAARPPRPARSFAGLLEEYAAPERKFPPQRERAASPKAARSHAADLDELEDDVATLTYEHALKAHARYHRQPDPVPPQPTADQPKPAPESPGGASAESQAFPSFFAPAQPVAAPRKSSSVTVRLTAEEDERLRARAAEAGLTVSAYLRSCAFEVESLRAQVKQAVAQLRRPDPPPTTPRSNWLARIGSFARPHPGSHSK